MGNRLPQITEPSIFFRIHVKMLSNVSSTGGNAGPTERLSKCRGNGEVRAQVYHYHAEISHYRAQVSRYCPLDDIIIYSFSLD